MRASRRGFLKGLGALVAMPTLLAACQTPAPPTAAPPTAAPAPAKSGARLDLGGYTGPALSSQTIKLRLMRQVYAPAGDAWWKDMYAQWGEAYPNVTVQEETVPYGDLNTKLQTYVAAGDAPDIMMGRGDFVQAYVFNKIALNLGDYLSADFVNDVTPAIKAQRIVGGKLYAMPWEHNQNFIYFNKAMFEKAGAPMPPETADLTAGWTWDQFADACKKLLAGLNSGGDVAVYPFASSEFGNGGPGSNYWYEGSFIRSQGDPNAPKDSTAYRTLLGVSEDGLTASGYVDTPEAIKGMQLYQSIFTQKFSPTVAAARQFEDQKAAMKIGGNAHATRFKNPDTGVKFSWGVTPMPRGKVSFSHTSGDSPLAWAKSKAPAESAAFLAFVHNDKNRVAWHKAWGSLPARTSLYDKLGLTELPSLLAIATTRAGYAPPVTPGYLEYFGAMNSAVKDIALGANPEDRLHKVAKEIDGLLASYKK